jgi:hypothetical protein
MIYDLISVIDYSYVLFCFLFTLCFLALPGESSAFRTLFGSQPCPEKRQVTTSAGQTIYVHVLCPAGQLSVAAVEAIGSSLQQGGQAVRVACQSLRRAF